MNVIVDFTLIPIGVGVSLSKYVAACQKVIDESGLSNNLHANGTNIEGDWDLVMETIKKCHEKIHEMGAPRIASSIKLGTRVDRGQSMDDKIKSVKSKC